MCTFCRAGCMHFTRFHCQTMPSTPVFLQCQLELQDPSDSASQARIPGAILPLSRWTFKAFNTSNDLRRIFTPKTSKTYCRLSDPPCFPKSVTIDDMSFMPHRFLKPGSVFARTCSIWQQHCDFYNEHASHQIPETAGARISLCFCLKFLIAFGCCWNLRHFCNIW